MGVEECRLTGEHQLTFAWGAKDMKVFVEPTGLHSRAMRRVARALMRHAPPGVEETKDREAADLTVLHVIGPGSLEGHNLGQSYAVIQYCWKSGGMTQAQLDDLWSRAEVVWSYYRLPISQFYHAPLGLDPVFVNEPFWTGARPIPVLTSGYVSGPLSEAIEEVAEAANRKGMNVIHIGPSQIEGMKPRSHRWAAFTDLDDDTLVSMYDASRWVSGLRHIEGFELPALEGLVRGARPIVFDRSDMSEWYEGHAVFVPECDGEALVGYLESVFQCNPRPVTEAERKRVLERFGWEKIAAGFWERAL